MLHVHGGKENHAKGLVEWAVHCAVSSASLILYYRLLWAASLQKWAWFLGQIRPKKKAIGIEPNKAIKQQDKKGNRNNTKNNTNN